MWEINMKLKFCRYKGNRLQPNALSAGVVGRLRPSATGSRRTPLDLPRRPTQLWCFCVCGRSSPCPKCALNRTANRFGRRARWRRASVLQWARHPSSASSLFRTRCGTQRPSLTVMAHHHLHTRCFCTPSISFDNHLDQLMTRIGLPSHLGNLLQPWSQNLRFDFDIISLCQQIYNSAEQKKLSYTVFLCKRFWTRSQNLSHLACKALDTA